MIENITIEEAIERLSSMFSSNMSPVTIRNYSRDVRRITSACSCKTLKDIYEHLPEICEFIQRTYEHPKTRYSKCFSLIKTVEACTVCMNNAEIINGLRQYARSIKPEVLACPLQNKCTKPTTSWTELCDVFLSLENDESQSSYIRIIAALYRRYPRRTRDFVDMKILRNESSPTMSSNRGNVLNLISTPPTFVFREWKNNRRRGKYIPENERQRVDILVIEADLVSFLNSIITSHQRYVLENDKGVSINEQHLAKILERLGIKYSVNLSINGIRHSIATHYNDSHASLRDYTQLAKKMGTSLNMLDGHYIDYISVS